MNKKITRTTDDLIVWEKQLVEQMSTNLHLAKSQYPNRFKSKHWDIFPKLYSKKIAEHENWMEFRNNGLTNGLDWGTRPEGEIGPNITSDPQIVESLVNAFNELIAMIGIDFYSTYCETILGNPMRAIIDNQEVNWTDIRLVYNAWRINSLLTESNSKNLTIVDIGGGYGGLIAKLKMLYPKAKFISFDLPEVNAVQTWYLSHLYPDANILDYQSYTQDSSRLINGDFDFAILPGWCIESVADDSVDLFINIRSMMEMNKTTIAFYFDHIHRAIRSNGFFYCANRYTKNTVGEPILIKEYPFDEQWIFRISETIWNQPAIHEKKLKAHKRLTRKIDLQM